MKESYIFFISYLKNVKNTLHSQIFLQNIEDVLKFTIEILILCVHTNAMEEWEKYAPSAKDYSAKMEILFNGNSFHIYIQ